MPETFFGWVGFIIEKYGPLLLAGAGITLLLAIIGTIVGFFLGLGVAIVRTIPVHPKDSLLKKVGLKIARGACIVYVQIFRATPMMVQAMVIYYGLAYGGIDLSPMLAAFIIISINTGAYMAEIVRGGVISVDKGQTEGAQSIGMTHWQTMTSVILPQAIRNIMPSIGNEFIVNIKDSSVLSVISVAELFFTSKSAAGTYFKYFEVFAVTCVMYFIMTFTITQILMFLERRMDGPASYELIGKTQDENSDSDAPGDAGKKKSKGRRKLQHDRTRH